VGVIVSSWWYILSLADGRDSVVAAAGKVTVIADAGRGLMSKTDGKGYCH